MRYAAAAAAIFTGELLLKNQAEKRLEWGKQIKICRGKILLHKYHNYGVALNLLEKRPGLIQALCGGMLLILGSLWFWLIQKKENPGVLLAFALLLGGGASNYYDRLKRGYVVDYFSFHTPFKSLNRIIFNLSDLCIFLGGMFFAFFVKG